MTRTLDGWKQVAAGIGLAASLMMVAAVYSVRTGESPDAVVQKNAESHRCDDPECGICECERDWLQRHPGSQSGELADAAEFGHDLNVLFPAAPSSPSN